MKGFYNTPNPLIYIVDAENALIIECVFVIPMPTIRTWKNCGPRRRDELGLFQFLPSPYPIAGCPNLEFKAYQLEHTNKDNIGR